MSNNLYTINTQLMEIQRLMNYYRLNLGNKEEELSRLNEALIDLVNNKSDFKGTKWICMKPMWDYVACPYPQGHLSDDTNVFFNHERITDIIFKGFESEGELILRKKILGLTGDGTNE
ncbi:DUF4176 domain-containing protein [Virgibacillus kimchii]